MIAGVTGTCGSGAASAVSRTIRWEHAIDGRHLHAIVIHRNITCSWNADVSASCISSSLRSIHEAPSDELSSELLLDASESSLSLV